MADADVVNSTMVMRACGWLANVLTDTGGALILVPGVTLPFGQRIASVRGDAAA